MFIAYFPALLLTLVPGLGAARLCARVLMLPKHVVLALIALLCFTGTHTIQNNVFDIVFGYVLRKVRISPAPHRPRYRAGADIREQSPPRDPPVQFRFLRGPSAHCDGNRRRPSRPHTPA
jgi:hypothetical protein